MQPPFQKNSNQGERMFAHHSRSLLLTCIILGTMAVLAWLFPGSKRDAVLGHFSYVQFWLAIFATLGALSALAVGLMPPPRRRAAGFRVGAVWVGVVSGLLLVELAALLLPARKQMDNPWYLSSGGGLSASDELPFERPAHLKWKGLSRGDLALMNGDPDPDARVITFETDREGFHNGKEILHADLITIGDSYTEAGNVPEAENFSTLIGQKLELTSRNLGRAGYSTPSELIVLRKYGLRCQPRIVVWQVTESNDLDDALRFKKWVRGGRRRFFDYGLDWKWQRTEAWRQHSPTFQAFELLRNHDPRPWPYDGLFLDPAGMKHPVRFINCPSPGGSVRDHPGWPMISKALTAGAGECRSNEIKLLVVLIPTKFRVLGPFTRMADTLIPSPPVAQQVTGTNTLPGLLQSLCGSLGVTFADATSCLKNRAKAGELVYLRYDTHLSPIGHRAIADLVVERLGAISGLPPR